jgi:hypothetical protein
MAAKTPLRELCRVMVMTVNLPIVLIIAILGTKHCWTYRTGEMIYMVFVIQCSDI